MAVSCEEDGLQNLPDLGGHDDDDVVPGWQVPLPVETVGSAAPQRQQFLPLAAVQEAVLADATVRAFPAAAAELNCTVPPVSERVACLNMPSAVAIAAATGEVPPPNGRRLPMVLRPPETLHALLRRVRDGVGSPQPVEAAAATGVGGAREPAVDRLLGLWETVARAANHRSSSDGAGGVSTSLLPRAIAAAPWRQPENCLAVAAAAAAAAAVAAHDAHVATGDAPGAGESPAKGALAAHASTGNTDRNGHVSLPGPLPLPSRAAKAADAEAKWESEARRQAFLAADPLQEDSDDDNDVSRAHCTAKPDGALGGVRGGAAAMERFVDGVARQMGVPTPSPAPPRPPSGPLGAKKQAPLQPPGPAARRATAEAFFDGFAAKTGALPLTSTASAASDAHGARGSFLGPQPLPGHHPRDPAVPVGGGGHSPQPVRAVTEPLHARHGPVAPSRPSFLRALLAAQDGPAGPPSNAVAGMPVPAIGLTTTTMGVSVTGAAGCGGVLPLVLHPTPLPAMAAEPNLSPAPLRGRGSPPRLPLISGWAVTSDPRPPAPLGLASAGGAATGGLLSSLLDAVAPAAAAGAALAAATSPGAGGRRSGLVGPLIGHRRGAGSGGSAAAAVLTALDRRAGAWHRNASTPALALRVERSTAVLGVWRFRAVVLFAAPTATPLAHLGTRNHRLGERRVGPAFVVGDVIDVIAPLPPMHKIIAGAAGPLARRCVLLGGALAVAAGTGGAAATVVLRGLEARLASFDASGAVVGGGTTTAESAGWSAVAASADVVGSARLGSQVPSAPRQLGAAGAAAATAPFRYPGWASEVGGSPSAATGDGHSATDGTALGVPSSRGGGNGDNGESVGMPAVDRTAECVALVEDASSDFPAGPGAEWRIPQGVLWRLMTRAARIAQEANAAVSPGF